ncbi:hypothetical protein SLA2020_419920 [Shorea laevis]
MNTAWLGMFPGAFSHHLLALKSDHAPILVIATKMMNGFRNKRPKLFRFENYWTKEPECEEKIKDGWKNGEGDTNMARVLSKIASCGSLLTAWSQDKFRNIPDRIKILQNELLSVRNGTAQDNNLRKMEALEKDLNDWQQREEVLWKQRSRVQWLKEGDKNTAFFHNKAFARRKKNHIAGLLDDRDILVSDKTRIEGICISISEIYSLPNTLALIEVS